MRGTVHGMLRVATGGCGVAGWGPGACPWGGVAGQKRRSIRERAFPPPGQAQGPHCSSTFPTVPTKLVALSSLMRPR